MLFLVANLASDMMGHSAAARSTASGVFFIVLDILYFVDYNISIATE
jgi:hypothetical protein